jgi:hypothetical protein
MLEYILSAVLALVGLFIRDLLTADEVHIRITVNGVDKIRYDKVEPEDDEDEE